MLNRLTKQVSHFLSVLGQMIRLAWNAHPLIFSGAATLAILQSLFPLANIWLTKLLLDVLTNALKETLPRSVFVELLPILTFQGILLALGQIIGPANSFLDAELSRYLGITIQKNIYSKVGSLAGIQYFEDASFHDILRLSLQGTQLGPSEILRTGFSFLQSFISLTSFIWVLIIFNPLLTGLVILAAIPQFIVQMRIGSQRFVLAQNMSPNERRMHYYSFILSDSQMAKDIRLYNLVDFFLDGLVYTYKRIHTAKRSQELMELRWQLILSAVSIPISISTFVIVVAEATRGNLSVGDVIFYTTAVSAVQSALVVMIYSVAGINQHALFFSQYETLQTLPQPIKVTSSPCKVQSLSSGIELRNVSFRYSDHHPWILRQVNLYIPAGKCIALVGLNGAGKSTLVKLLTRLYDPNEGEILWDGIDISRFDPQELRAQLGVVLQDFARYALSATENIGLGNVESITNSIRIHQAARKAGIHEKISRLSHGYDTILNRWLAEDNNVTTDLSSGEWQQIALARAYMRDSSFIILDEPTADLDAQAEYDFYVRFTNLVRKQTSLVISHRFSTVKMADVIAVLEHGKITEYGVHENLIANGGTYSQLYQLQADRYS